MRGLRGGGATRQKIVKKPPTCLALCRRPCLVESRSGDSPLPPPEPGPDVALAPHVSDRHSISARLIYCRCNARDVTPDDLKVSNSTRHVFSSSRPSVRLAAADRPCVMSQRVLDVLPTSSPDRKTQVHKFSSLSSAETTTFQLRLRRRPRDKSARSN